MAEHNTNGAAGVNMDIYRKRCNQPVVVLACRFSYANQVKVRVALYVQIDRDRVDFRYVYNPLNAEGTSVTEELRRYNSFTPVRESTSRSR